MYYSVCALYIGEDDAGIGVRGIGNGSTGNGEAFALLGGRRNTIYIARNHILSANHMVKEHLPEEIGWNIFQAAPAKGTIDIGHELFEGRIIGSKNGKRSISF